MINPTPIGLQSSLNAGDHDKLKILLKNCLIPSQFNQELLEEENTSVFRKKYRTRDVDRPIRDEMRAVR